MFREEQRRLLQNDRETARRVVIEKREQREYKTLIGLLETLEEGPVRRALMNTWSNIEMIWKMDRETALNHHGKVLTVEERNRLQHATNGNIKDAAKQRGHQAMTVQPYERPKRQTVKKPTFWKNYYFKEGLMKIPYETKAEEEVRFYGWRCYSRPRSLCFHSKSLTQVLS